jgi:gliding motility-associated-like protein
MKRIVILSKFITLGIFALFANAANAQITGTGDEYIKGDYVEVGIATTGSFGGCTAPSGYHPNVGAALGFVSDPDKDGWLVSLPGRTTYMGDYFVPGSPYEGWDVQINGTKYSSFNCPSGSSFGGATFTGTGYGNVSYVTTALDQTAIWHGLIGTSLDITQTTVVKKSKAYFVIYVDLVNTGATTLNNLYYYRGLDPDNDEPWPLGGFPTDNRIVYQPNALSKNCLATANGRGYPNAYLGLGTKDCRAKCMYFASWRPSFALNDAYNQTGTASANFYTVGSVQLNSDWAIGMVYNLGSLAPGQKTSLAYAYILSTADLDSALGETAPKFVSGGVPYAPYSTFRVCPGKTVALRVINGGQYRWIWTPSTYMLPVTGTTIVGPGGTIPAVTGTTTYANGAAYGDSVLVQVNGPKTYVAMGISNCDTQYLTFYVDTISFAVSPSVTSPVRYCEGDAATALTAGAATGAVLKWYTVPTGGTGSATAPTPSTVFTGTGSFDTVRYYVSQVNTAGCETPRAEIDVIITKKPTAPTVVTPIIYCIGATTLPLTAVGTNLKWYDAATAGTKYAGTPTPANSPAGTTSYFVSQTLNGCESDRSQLDVTISQITAAFTKLKDSLCGSALNVYSGNSVNSPAGGYTSLWSFGDGVSDTNQNTSHSYADLRADVTVKLIVTNVNGCQDSTKQQVHIFPVPSMTIAGSDTLLCQGGSVDFTGTATLGYSSLAWDFGDGDPAFNVLQVRHAFTKSGLFNVKISGTYPACPGVNASMNVNIIPIPNVNLGRDTSICPGNSMLNLHNLNTAPVGKYIWNTGDTTASIQVAHEGDYWLKAMNGDCNASDSISITKACYLDIPNAFTPGSGNDIDGYFLPRQLLSKSVVTFEMKIFDRWGQLLFESTKTDGRGWDGSFKGQPSPFGVYVYLIKVSYANGLSESYQGNVTLLR